MICECGATEMCDACKEAPDHKKPFGVNQCDGPSIFLVGVEEPIDSIKIRFKAMLESQPKKKKRSPNNSGSITTTYYCKPHAVAGCPQCTK